MREYRFFWLFILSLTGAGCAAAPNLAYCDENTPCLAEEASVCDLATNQCTAPPPDQACQSESDCTSETEPLCIEEVCVGCIDDRECSQFAGRSQCRSDGACVECLSSSDCGAGEAPVCDPELFACRPCLDHGECASGVCQLDQGSCVAESAIVYVDPGGDDDGSCSLDAPCRTFSRAMDQVTDERSLILAAAGDYVGHVSIAKSVTISAHDVNLYAQQPDVPVIEVLGDADVTIEGMAVRNASGKADLAAGIVCTGGARLSVSDLIIAGNAGTGIEANDCTMDITSSVLEDNQIGIEMVGAVATADQVTISDHRSRGISLGLGAHMTIGQSRIADNLGHGIYAFHAAVIDIRRSVIHRNGGGGLYGEDAEVMAFNNVISKNGRAATMFPSPSAPSGDGGIRLQEGNHLRPVRGRIEHNTVVDNYGDRDNGTAGILCVEPATMTMHNNLIAHNTVDSPNLSPEIPRIVAQVAGSCAHTHTLAHPQAPSGTGNTNEAPQFVDRKAGDYHLVSDSPGEDKAAFSDVAMDVDGDGRPSGDGPDIGADEV